MAFAYTISWKEEGGELNKRFTKTGKLVRCGGSFTNGVADTGGNIVIPFGDEVLHVTASSETGAAGIQLAVSGMTITLTCTADYDGSWEATILQKNK